MLININNPMVGRNIPRKIKVLMLEKFKGRCGFPNCKWPAVDLHHTKRFAMIKRHLPEEIVPLCRIHHELAHAGLIENEQFSLDNWSLSFNQKILEKTGAKIGDVRIDQKVQKCKKWAIRIKRLT